MTWCTACHYVYLADWKQKRSNFRILISLYSNSFATAAYNNISDEYQIYPSYIWHMSVDPLSEDTFTYSDFGALQKYLSTEKTHHLAKLYSGKLDMTQLLQASLWDFVPRGQ